MKYLLDTNVLIYFLEEDYSNLSLAQIEIIRNPENKIYVSEASFYELSIKARLQKQLSFTFDVLKLNKYRKIFGFKLLKAKTKDYLGIIDVPKVSLTTNKLHGDPFDLLIISQALKRKYGCIIF